MENASVTNPEWIEFGPPDELLNELWLVGPWTEPLASPPTLPAPPAVEAEEERGYDDFIPF